MERPAATTMRGKPLTLLGPELKAGEKAPDFDAVSDGLQPVNLEKTGHTVRIFSVVPSLDTPVCDAQTKRFNEEAAKLPGVEIYTVSMDLPFAQKRFCGAEGIENVTTASAFRDSFGEDYGTTIADGPMAGLLARAVVVIGADGNVAYTQLVPEIAEEPDYDAALAALG